MACVTTLAGNDRRRGSVGGHRHVATAKQAAAGHPNRKTDCKKQSHHTKSLLPSHKEAQGKQPPKGIRSTKQSSSKSSTSVTDQLLAFIRSGRRRNMSIDKNKIKTQDELNEPAPMDEADKRAEAEMRRLQDETRKEVAEG